MFRTWSQREFLNLTLTYNLIYQQLFECMRMKQVNTRLQVFNAPCQLFFYKLNICLRILCIITLEHPANEASIYSIGLAPLPVPWLLGGSSIRISKSLTVTFVWVELGQTERAWKIASFVFIVPFALLVALGGAYNGNAGVGSRGVFVILIFVLWSV